MNNPFMPLDVDARWQILESAGPNLQSRELFRFVLAAVQQQTHEQEIEQVLTWAEELQDRDAKSETFGNFRWYRKNEKPADRNAVEFAMEVGVLVWMHHRASLTDGARERLERLIRLSVEGIRRHQPAVSYTNIYTMKMWNCIGIGEGFPYAGLAEEGYAMLDIWLAEIASQGIHEYVSPTYSPVSMECVENIARYSSHDEVCAKANRALRLCWSQLAANWFPNCERLVGAHSRDYDYLGTGVRNQRVRNRMSGLLKKDEAIPVPDKGDMDLYIPDDSIYDEVYEILKTIPRMVSQKWGKEPYEISTTYVGKQFAIGVAGAAYGPIDKSLTVHLGDRDTPNISFFCDARGDGYGQRQFQLADGHSKALHLVPFLTSVQNGSEVLFLAAPEPSGRHYFRSAPQPTCLLSHLILPASGDAYIGNEQISSSATLACPVPLEKPVFLRYGSVAVGIRFVLAQNTSGSEAPVTFVRDDEGLSCGAMRLTCEHTDKPAQAGGIVAIWMGVKEDVGDDEFSGFRSHFWQDGCVSVGESKVSVAVPGWQSTMRLDADLKNQVRVVVAGGEAGVEDVLFGVNGRDLGREILA